MSALQSPPNVTTLHQFVTRQDLAKLFKKTILTVDNWRDRHRLPSVCIPGVLRPSVRFVLDDVVGWADKNGKGYDARVLASLKARARRST